MRQITMRQIVSSAFSTIAFVLLACGGTESLPHDAHHDHHTGGATEARGPHGGRVLTSNDFTIELAIHERGTPPEFRAWASKNGQAVAPTEVSLRVKLERLGGRVDDITFSPEGDYLRGGTIVSEPHSFAVSVEAQHAGEQYEWHYESFEGRTRIAPDIAESLGVEVAVAGPAILHEIVTVYGRIRVNPKNAREIRARFDGVVRGVFAEIGSAVAKGDRLLTIESNESLKTYAIHAPIAGVVTQRDANPGEQTGGRLLLTITDPSSVWADLSIFPGDRNRVRVGNPVSIVPASGGEPVTGTISTVEVLARQDQSVIARAVVANTEARLVPGTLVSSDITVGEHDVPLAVRREGLQSFRDFTVVYAQVGDQYEARMLELGRRGPGYVEVLGGLAAGTRYVATNSYVIKADIEKSGASHDH